VGCGGEAVTTRALPNQALVSTGPSATDVQYVTLPERTPDGHPQVWLRYSPEPWEPFSAPEREINLWVRRCEVFSSREQAVESLNELIGEQSSGGRMTRSSPSCGSGSAVAGTGG